MDDGKAATQPLFLDTAPARDGDNPSPIPTQAILIALDLTRMLP